MEFKTSKPKNVRGHGSAVVLESGAVQITDADTQQVYQISAEQIGSYCFKPEPGTALSPVSYRLSEDTTMLYNLGPWSGNYIVFFNRIKAKEDELPKWEMQPGGKRRTKDGRTFMAQPKPVFDVILTVATGEFKGAEVMLRLGYLFTMALDGSCDVHGSKRDIAMLQGFLEQVGFDFQNDILQYNENVLPALEKLIMGKEPKPFQVKFENGWIREIIPLPVGVTIETQVEVHEKIDEFFKTNKEIVEELLPEATPSESMPRSGATEVVSPSNPVPVQQPDNSGASNGFQEAMGG
jgi:hypothetical protein